MSDKNLRDHLSIVALLPDYVLGKLDETSLRRVARHLESCPVCRLESANAMDVLGSLADVAPPPARLRQAVLQHAAAQDPAAEREHLAAARERVEPDTTREITSIPGPPRIAPRLGPFTRLGVRWAPAAAAIVIFLMFGFAGWRSEQYQAANTDDRISALVSDPAMAYPLDDSDLPVSAAGVIFAEQDGREVYLIANGLPVLPRDQRYQVWLFTTGNTQESAGLVSVEADGDVQALLQTPGPFASYVGIGLTAEPQAGSVVPTSELVLGGSFPPVSAMLRSSAS